MITKLKQAGSAYGDQYRDGGGERRGVVGVEDAGHKTTDEPCHDKPGAKDDNLSAADVCNGVQTGLTPTFVQIKPAKINLSPFAGCGVTRACTLACDSG